ncbi:carbohydrate ABC transporter permease [Niveispirillum fermenti]|uniref:carbohydrate ABC transporter permease n=1 Tax=Niveispirillum fermenti TaxID=1233113 RepID=UPI003A8A0A97
MATITRPNPAARRPQATPLLRGLFLSFMAFAILLPVIWIASGAFKQLVDIFQLRILFTPTLDNFGAIADAPFLAYHKMANSLIVALWAVIITIPLALLAAYSLSRYRLPGERLILFALLSTQFLPSVVVVLPFFLLFRDLGLLDTRTALVAIKVAMMMPFAVWMLKGFIDGIPIEIEESARVDGAASLRVIRDMVVPMALPGIITTAIFCFIMAWNEFLFALILTSRDAVTLPIALSMLTTDEGDFWHFLSAAGLLVMLPMIGLALLIQKHFTGGSTAGSSR